VSFLSQAENWEREEGESNLLTTHNDDMKCIYGMLLVSCHFGFFAPRPE